jgi:pleckstrin homology domain-containing family H
MESATSEDYAIPPDALSCCESTSLDTSMPSLLAARSTSCVLDTHVSHSAASTVQKESLEKQGYLTKLGGKLKTWRKRWFVLKNGVIMYWKSQVQLLLMLSLFLAVFVAFVAGCHQFDEK